MQIDERAASFVGDAPHRAFDGIMAATPACSEDIAHEAVGVHAHQHRLIARVFDVAFDHRDVRVAIDLGLIDDHAEFAVSGRNHRFGEASHVALVRHAIADEFRHGEHLQVVFAAELGELRHARHGAVVVHDFADDARGNQSGEAGEIDGGFGLSGADEDSAFAGAKRERCGRDARDRWDGSRDRWRPGWCERGRRRRFRW